MVEIWLAFSVGLAASGHCLGMCGGIVSALALSQRDADAGRRFLFNILYHAGRICTYALLGLLVGLAARAGLVDGLKPAVRWLFLAANLFVVTIGIFTALGVRSLGIAALDGSGLEWVTRSLSCLARSGSVLAALPAGLLMGLLPCGLVYGVLITAATSGSAIKGGAMMLAFGGGTLPALLAYGQVASTLSALGRGLFQRCMGVVVALLGAIGVLKALIATG
ncbi:MAG TPA: sulfite exporter TauE/SafE family protein [Desulfuromonadales bacterium]|nr:sulfite exporter TauE/SafE family protein [Desulfuromonadales bacterium]